MDLTMHECFEGIEGIEGIFKYKKLFKFNFAELPQLPIYLGNWGN